MTNSTDLHSFGTASEASGENFQQYKDLEMAFSILFKWPVFGYTTIGLFGNLMTFLISLFKENSAVSVCIYMRALSIVDSIILINNLCYLVVFGHLDVFIPDRKNYLM